VPDIIEEIEQAASEPQSHTADGESVVDKTIESRIEGDKYAKQVRALQGTNVNGGPLSGWGGTRPARVIPPGAV